MQIFRGRSRDSFRRSNCYGRGFTVGVGFFFPQQIRRDRVQRDDAVGVCERSAGRPPDPQTLADRRDRDRVRAEAAAAGERHVERYVRDRVQTGLPAPVGRVRLSVGRRLVTVVQRHPLPLSVGRAVRRPGQNRAPGQYV